MRALEFVSPCQVAALNVLKDYTDHEAWVRDALKFTCLDDNDAQHVSVKGEIPNLDLNAVS